MRIHIGLDIGGTKLIVAAADTQGVLLRQTQCPTPRDLDEGLELLKAMTRRVAGEDSIAAIGASAGGPLDHVTGIVSPLHQPQWRDVPLRAIFEREFGRPFAVDVDTNAAALAEYRWGGDTPERLLYLTLSTGMGGGLVIGGALYRGAGGVHPEVGHQAVPPVGSFPHPVICECGSESCLESFVSGNGIRRLYGKPAEQLDPAEWAEVAVNLGLGLRNMAVCYAPDVIAIGGGVAVGGGEPFLTQARRVMAQGLKLVPAPEVRLSRLGYETALRGAIALAMTAAGESGGKINAELNIDDFA
ncbi:MAG: ROK family protein [Capsulimonas sp.]|uniref:ROK family protein n=1 Tax=Capsulimonas sp. TaxID=2494211 RepID=UPI003263ECB9